jgi:hypothetical protein
MVSVQLKGGLGNQMFQLASGLVFSKKFDLELTIDLSFLESNISETNTFTPRKYELIIFPKIAQFKINNNVIRSVREVNNNNFNSSFFFERILGFDFVLNDYFQSESFFFDYREEIKELFQFDIYNFPKDSLAILTKIKCHKLISIHMRKGDYLKPQIKSIHGVVGLDFYLKAIDYFKQRFINPKFILFSDDPDLAESELKPYLSDLFVVKNTPKNNSWFEMYLMSQCYGNIIANSSFSWWGAWLNNNPDKIVIAPKKWFNDTDMNAQTSDLIPEKWIRI